MREGDRAEPLRFAGRKAELREMEALLGSVKKGKAGLTRIITAAPGAGKTALLRKLEARWKRSKAARPVVLEASAFGDPAQVIKRMFLALEDPAAGRFASVETKTEAEHAEGGVNVVGLAAKAGGRSSHSLQRTNLQETFFDAFEELEDGATPVVLLVDEAQLWGTDQDSGERRISSLLVQAHTNLRQLPLLIVAAGLGDAPEVVAERGASKLATGSRLVLGPLADDEMREVCDKFFDRYRIAGSKEQRAVWTEAIIAGTGRLAPAFDQCVARSGRSADRRARRSGAVVAQSGARGRARLPKGVLRGSVGTVPGHAGTAVCGVQRNAARRGDCARLFVEGHQPSVRGNAGSGRRNGQVRGIHETAAQGSDSGLRPQPIRLPDPQHAHLCGGVLRAKRLSDCSGGCRSGGPRYGFGGIRRHGHGGGVIRNGRSRPR